jgi:hypothetical protein
VDSEPTQDQSRRDELAGLRDQEQDGRGRQQDQRDQDQDRRDGAAELREQQLDSREQEGDRREDALGLYRDAVRTSPQGARDLSRWLTADARALLARRQDSVDRDSSRADRQEDEQSRLARRAQREQAEVDRQVVPDPESGPGDAGGRPPPPGR